MRIYKVLHVLSSRTYNGTENVVSQIQSMLSNASSEFETEYCKGLLSPFLFSVYGHYTENWRTVNQSKNQAFFEVYSIQQTGHSVLDVYYHYL